METQTTTSISLDHERRFLSKTLNLSNWEAIQPYFDDLLSRQNESADDLADWLRDRSELESVLAEALGWKYIRMTCDTQHEELKNDYEHFITEIEPKVMEYSNKLDEKFLNDPNRQNLPADQYDLPVKLIEQRYKIFREKNIPVQTQIQKLQSEYGSVIGKLTIELEGKELTLQQAAVYLQKPDRKLREAVYHKVQEARYAEKDSLDSLFNKLINLRHELAQNADFDNFRDYMFASLARFDYTPQDCFQFHQSVSQEVVPLLEEITSQRKKALQVDHLRPYDLSVDIYNRPPLKPFESGEELQQKSIECLGKVDPFFADVVKLMIEKGHLDLESRKGKAPGGYNYPLYETGLPFIFMNAASTFSDMITMLHESGHAVHSVLTKDLDIVEHKALPSEVAELASMSMELLTMDYWHVFMPDDEDLKRAKRSHLERILDVLPWVATIDKFQHWIYENPHHSIEERKVKWNEIHDEFSSSVIDWSGLEQYKNYIWQKQLHLYEVPFYYIEYAIAQLGAVGIWMNYRKDPQKAVKQYLDALKLGYTKPIGEIYKTAGIRFDFSQEYIRELAGFVKKELDSL